MKLLSKILVLLIIAGFSGKLTAQHLVHYANERDNYSIKYPEGWRKTDNFNSNLSFVAMSPEVSESEDGVREMYTIVLFDLENKPLSFFYEQYKASHEAEKKSWKLNSEGEMLAGKTKVLLFVSYYSNEKTNHTNGDVVYLIKHNDKALVLTCTSSFDELDKYRIIFDKIAQSYSPELFPEQ